MSNKKDIKNKIEQEENKNWIALILFMLGIIIMWGGIKIINDQFITYIGLLTSIISGVKYLR